MALIARRQTAPSRITAVCLATDEVGDVVHLTDALGGTIAVESVDISDGDKIPQVGVIVVKIDDTNCIVQVSGIVEGVYAGLTPEKVHWVGFDSKPTSTVPSPNVGNPRIYINAVGIAIDSTRLLLQDDQKPYIRIL